MLITFLGAPCSGKTTTAARLFADLKDAGYPAEFIAEQARLYIARLKLVCQKNDIPFPGLEETDQFRIMQAQWNAEQAFAAAGSDVIAIADSSVLNGMLYLSEPGRFEMRDFVEMEAKLVDIAFLCYPVKAPASGDPNRVHSQEQSRKLHDELAGIIRTYAPGVNVVQLHGDPNFRHTEAMRYIYGKLF